MRICVFAPWILPFNPKIYQGAEKIAGYIAKELLKTDDVLLVTTKRSAYFPNKIETVEPLQDWNTSWLEQEKKAYEVAEPLVKKFSPDIIIGHTWTGWEYIYSLKEEIPCTHTFHALPWNSNPPVENKNYITLSRWQRLIVYQTLEEDSTIIPNGIYLDEYPFCEEKEDYYLFLARIAREKGVHHIFTLAKKYPNKKFVIAGAEQPDPNYINKIKQTAKKFDNVTYKGEVSHEEKINLLQKAKALIALPSLPYIEVFGLYIVEALSCGTYVIGLRNGGLCDIIIDKAHGSLYDSVEEMDLDISYNPSDCRKRASDFAMEKTARQYRNFVKNVIHKSM